MNNNKAFIFKAVCAFIIGFSLFFSVPSQARASEDAKRILSLVDYIGGDYQNAVADGEVINEAEYTEMLEFSSQVKEIFQRLNAAEGDKADIGPELSELSALIKSKSPATQVETVSSGIKEKLIASYGIVPHPGRSPSYAKGQELYTENCSYCHGAAGAGDGRLSYGLNPKPSAFTDPEFAEGLSPFKVHNSMSFGIEGTAMPSFPMISEDEKWDVAFYVLTMGVNGAQAELDGAVPDIPEELSDYRTLATLTNADIIDRIEGLTDNRKERENALAYLRAGGADARGSANKSIKLTASILNESVELYSEGKGEEAYTKALDAYLVGFEKVEPSLFVKDRAFTASLENKFAELRSAVKSGKPLSEVEALNSELQAGLVKASDILGKGKQVTALISFANSFAIIVREGLESILIIAAIIAFLGATGARSSIKYIHYGWMSALVAGFLTWLVARTVISISGAQREVIEGVTALIAAAVLFYVSYWLITKIEVQKWKSYIKGKVEKAVTKKSVIALASVSFFAVYREAFETVLFYQALWFQAENTQSAVIWGFVAGAAVLAVLFFVIFKLALKIPIKYFFTVTSVFLYFLSFILVGKGIRELQEAGIVGITPLEYLPQAEALGIYPTLETALPQAILLVAFVFAFMWISYVNREMEKKEIAVSLSRIADDMKSMYAAFDHIKGHIIDWKRCEEIDIEARDLDHQIQDVITHVDELENKLGDFYDIVSKNKETSTKLN